MNILILDDGKYLNLAQIVLAAWSAHPPALTIYLSNGVQLNLNGQDAERCARALGSEQYNFTPDA